jgi:hypothetical protein
VGGRRFAGVVVGVAAVAAALTGCDGHTDIQRAGCDHMYPWCTWWQPAYPGMAIWFDDPPWPDVVNCMEVMERKFPYSLGYERQAACSSP